MNSSIIQEYLVSLGYVVNHSQLTKFQQAVKSAGDQIEGLASGMAKVFVGAGAAIITTLTGISAGTIGLMDNVASADLQFQLMARRTFMATDAFKKMKIAMDAIGVDSMADIIFGPPELRERYSQLVQDQERMLKILGGEDFEKQVRRIRDIRFEFTRFNVEMQYFFMNLTKVLSKSLFGDEVLTKLREFNKWFMENIPLISNVVARHLVPILKDTWAILKDIGEILGIVTSFMIQLMGEVFNDEEMKTGAVNLENIARALHHIANAMKSVMDAVTALVKLIPLKDLFDIISGGSISILQMYNALRGGQSSETQTVSPISKQQWQQKAVEAANAHNLDPSLLLGLIDRESSWNPYARNPKTGAIGFGQFMPGNANMYGQNAFDPAQNLDMTAHYLADLLAKHGGDVRGALAEYGGFKTVNPSQYQDYILGHRQRYQDAINAGKFNPSSSTSATIHNDIKVIAQTNASPHDIARTVADIVDERNRRTLQQLLLQQQGVYA